MSRAPGITEMRASRGAEIAIEVSECLRCFNAQENPVSTDGMPPADIAEPTVATCVSPFSLVTVKLVMRSREHFVLVLVNVFNTLRKMLLSTLFIPFFASYINLSKREDC